MAFAEPLQPAGKIAEEHIRCWRHADSGSCSRESAVELATVSLVLRMDSKSSKLDLHFALWAGLRLAVVVVWLLAEVCLP